MIKRPIYLSPPQYEGTLRPADQSMEVIGEFETDVKEHLGRTHAVALSSGTAAIHLALKVLGIRPGDVVLCQSLTYAASAFPICYEGATPVFIDSESDTWNLDPALLKQAVVDLTAKGQKPKAIIPVHLYGMPARMEEITTIAAEYDIPIIEDAAEALGAQYHGKPCGSMGTLSILSFNSNKIVTSSGGGMLLTDHQEYAERALYFANQAKESGVELTHHEVGYNYRMSHINASIGKAQFGILADRVATRRKLFDWYRKVFDGLAGIAFQPESDGEVGNRWLTSILIDPEKTGGITREDLRLAFEAENIETRPVWKPMHLQPVFKDAAAYTNGVSGRLFEQGLCLPSGSNMSEADLERIEEVIRRLGDWVIG